jgi:hypothetical protein
MYVGKGKRKGNGVVSVAPWDDQVAHLMSGDGLPRDKARDRVILDYLKRGDGDALAALLMNGHVPAPNIRFVLALMLLDNEAAETAIARHNMDPGAWWLPHRFVIKARPAQLRRPDGAAKAAGKRDTQATSGPVMPGLGYEAAIARLDQAVLATDATAGKAVAAARKTAPQGPGHKRKK